MRLINNALAIVLIFAAASMKAATIQVICVGNSITAGAGASYSYVESLGALMGSGYSMDNAGVGGSTLLKYGDSPYWDGYGMASILFYRNPDIMTIKLGSNDSKSNNWDLHKAEFAGDLSAMVDTFFHMATRPVIFLCYPAWAYSGSGINDYGIQNSVIEQEEMPRIDSVAARKGLRVIDLHSPLKNHKNLYQTNDGVHPNDQGQDTLAVYMYAALAKEPIVKRLPDSLLFISASGQTASLPARTLTINNIGPATTLAPVTVAHKASWLTLTVNSATLNTQGITNTIDLTKTPAQQGVYADTVVMTANGYPRQQQYVVTLRKQGTSGIIGFPGERLIPGMVTMRGSSGNITLQLPSVSLPATIAIIDLRGKTVASQKVSPGQRAAELAFGFAKGIYLARIDYTSMRIVIR